MAMEIYLKTREVWRKWLEKNHDTCQEVWLRYYKKPSGMPRIPYADAVEEALCFGWIDGKVKRINEDYYIQRFTPRRAGSRWSKYNIERIERLIKKGRMHEAGLKVYSEVVRNPGLIYDNKSDGDPVIPADLMNELKKNKDTELNFLNFTQSVRRIYVEWLNSAKRNETRTGRIAKIVALAEKNQKPGMM